MDQNNLQERHGHLRLKLAVSGAAETGHCGRDALEVAKQLGMEIAKQGAILVTPATSGFPFWSAMGAKQESGITIGFSPAANEREHVETYKLPLDYLDLVVYTGFGFPGRNLLLTRSVDAVFIGCGRIGTIHEFTVAFEEGKPIGVLEGDWEMDETVRSIIARANRPVDNIIFDKDPKRLVEKVIAYTKSKKIAEYSLSKPDISAPGVADELEERGVM